MKENNLITGIPRSGTSLLSSLIFSNCQSVVFSEPIWLKFLREISLNAQDFSENLLNKINSLRADIYNDLPVDVKLDTKRNLPTNYYKRNVEGKVFIKKKEQPVIFEKEYSTLPFFIKANAQFTSCLSELIENTKINKIFCVVRNPISCIMSWRSLNIPVSKGNMKIAERYSSTYLDFISGSKGLLHKQVLILDWFYSEFYKYSNSVEIIRYEELLNNPHRAIGKITKNNNPIINNLVSGNKNTHYAHNERQKIHDCLIKYGIYYKYFYENLDNY